MRVRKHTSGRQTPVYETILPETAATFAVRHFNARRWGFKWHYHPEVELTFIVNGQGTRFVGDSIESFSTGDLVLIGSNVPHTWASSPGYQRAESIVVQFRPEMWGPVFAGLPEMRPIVDLLRVAGRGIQVEGSDRADLEQAMHAMTKKQPGSTAQLVGLLGCLEIIACSKQTRTLSTSDWQTRTRDGQVGKMLGKILDAIHTGIAGGLSQADLAARANLSPAGFSRFFKRQVGRPYTQYLNEWRVSLACRALIETENAITSIAFDCGFNNLSNFNRRFSEIKLVTPSAYRRERRAVGA